jgi:hypothetical protein
MNIHATPPRKLPLAATTATAATATTATTASQPTRFDPRATRMGLAQPLLRATPPNLNRPVRSNNANIMQTRNLMKFNETTGQHWIHPSVQSYGSRRRQRNMTRRRRTVSRRRR